MKSNLVPLCDFKSEIRLKQFDRILKFFISVFVLFIADKAFSQNLPPPSSCVSNDLQLVSATLPPNPGDNICSCSGTRTLQLAINNKTGSTRTSFAFWATLQRFDQNGVLISSELITGCNGPIPKNAITTLPFNQITIQCNQSLKMVNLFLAWTSSSPNDTCPLNAALISPKCDTLPSIIVQSGVDASFTITNATCASTGNGSITTTAFGGTPPYTFSWSASNGGAIPTGQSTSQNLTNLVAGTYQVTITDHNGCQKVLSRTVTSPAALALGSCSKTDVTCNGGTNGTITAGTVTNSVGTVNYSWKNSSNTVVGTTASVSSLGAGTYTLTVTDDCSSKTCSVTVQQPAAPLSMGSCSKTDVTCFGGSNGSVSAGTVSGNVGTPGYSWKNSSNTVVGTTASVPNLPAGTYTLTVTDNCPAAPTCTVTIGGPSAALALGSCSKTDVTCFNGTNGSIASGAVTNSVGTVHYSWKNSSNTVVSTNANVSSLGAGTYTLTVTDDCSSQTCSVTVSQPAAALSMGSCSKTDVTCFGGSNGSVSAGTVSGNVGTPSYSWKNSSNTVVGTTASVPNLPAGTYTLTVTDNCPAAPTCTVTIGGPSAALALGSCSKTDVTCTAPGAVAAGTVTNSVGTVNYSWKNGSNTVVGNAANLGSLAAGTYTLTVTDDCSSRTCSVTVAAAPSISAPTVCIVQPSLCGSKGSVTITSPAPGANIQYTIDNGQHWQTSNVFSNLDAGSVTGIKVQVGDCISSSVDCSASSCAPGINKPITSNETSESKTTTQTTPVEEPISKLGVKAYPNPYNDHVTFVITSPKAGNASLEVVNLMGQKIKTVFQGHINAGSQSFDMSVPYSQRTTLFYVFKMGDNELNGKLLQLGR